MSRYRIQFVYFDLGNVLLFFDHERACQNVAALANCSPIEARQAIFESGLEDQYETGQLTDDQFHQAICQSLNADVSLADLKRAVSDIFELNIKILPLLSGLYRSGIPLGILSNTCHAHWEFIHNQRYDMLFDFFEVDSLSYVIGSMKPDREIYQAAAEQAGVPPESIFFTDDKHENIEGAIAAGFDAVLFENPIQLGRDLLARNLHI